ncbi:MAG: hypothetical protein IPO45_02135 [Saprospiraceae bacterium]|nr:hypothetical protein [Candidatus Brachybacter algidus]
MDNATFSADNWIGGNYSFDAQHSFSEDCENVPILEEVDVRKCSEHPDVPSGTLKTNLRLHRLIPRKV